MRQIAHSSGVAPDDWANRSIMFVVNVDWFFVSHRMPLALAAMARGAKVSVAASDTGEAHLIRAAGLDFIPLPFSRTGTGLLEQAKAFVALLRLYRRVNPDLVHHVTIKPVLYGSIAARLTRVPAVVNAISGLGSLFAPGRQGFLTTLARLAYRAALRGRTTRTIFQNPEDCDAFVEGGMVSARQVTLIRGSGVDTTRFVETPEPAGELIVVLPARMLWEKGVGVFVEAARQLRPRLPHARFVLVGRLDPSNPTAVTEAELRAWEAEGVVEWWGARSDMPCVMAGAAIVVLPTHYKEGLPKALLEAAACARPIVATDIPGCREIVRHDVNGLLVPAQNPAALADAIGTLLGDEDLRHRYGAASRRIAEREFTEDIVVGQTMTLYRELLAETHPASTHDGEPRVVQSVPHLDPVAARVPKYESAAASAQARPNADFELRLETRDVGEGRRYVPRLLGQQPVLGGRAKPPLEPHLAGHHDEAEKRERGAAADVAHPCSDRPPV